MNEFRLQLKLKDGQNLGYIQMRDNKPYYDYGYSEATLFDPVGVLNLLNKISLDKYDVYAEVPYTTNKGRRGTTALKNEELKTYMKNELGKVQVMENVMREYYYRVSFAHGRNVGERYYVCNYSGSLLLKKPEELLSNSTIAVFKGTQQALRKWLLSYRASVQQALEKSIIPIIEEFIGEDKLMSIYAMNSTFTGLATGYEIPKDINIPKATSNKYFFESDVIELNNKSEQVMENKNMNEKMIDKYGREVDPKEWEEKEAKGLNEKAEADEHEANELVLYMENTQRHYNNIMAVVKNLARKMARGNFDKELAVKGMLYPVNDGARAYKKEFSGEGYEKYAFSPATRELAARELLDRYMEDIENEAKAKSESKINEADEQFAPDAEGALADFLGTDVENVSAMNYDHYGIPMFEADSEEWAVTDDYDLVEEAAKEEVIRLIDELGEEALNWKRMGGLKRYLIGTSINSVKAAKVVLATDGAGHILSSYDGEMVEHDFEGTTFYMFRQN